MFLFFVILTINERQAAKLGYCVKLVWLVWRFASCASFSSDACPF